MFNKAEWQKEYNKKYKRRYRKRISFLNKRHYEANKKVKLMRKKLKYKEDKDEKYKSFNGHIAMIHSATKRYVSRCGGKMVSYQAFKNASLADPMYNELFAVWRESGYDEMYSPMITRLNFMKPYSIKNMRWTTKGKTGITKAQKIGKKIEIDLIRDIESSLSNGSQVLSEEETAKLVEAFKKQTRKRRKLRRESKK